MQRRHTIDPWNPVPKRNLDKFDQARDDALSLIVEDTYLLDQVESVVSPVRSKRSWPYLAAPLTIGILLLLVLLL